MSKFQIILISVFAGAIVIGIATFALSKAGSTPTADLVAWGTVSHETFDALYTHSTLPSTKSIKISYVKKDPSTFDGEFVEALANGNGPDIVLLRDDQIYKNRNKIFVIPYSNYTERNFKDRFIEEGELFLSTEGVIALPVIVDPMVMYWNRDIFSNALVSQPPKYWDEVYGLINKITRKDTSGNILQSALALGEWTNITNAKEILAMLLLQAGTPITSRTAEGVDSVLNGQFGYPVAPSQSATNFYTQFSNPTGATYTWNRSLPTSLNFFLSGNLAMYLGFASEIFPVQQKNSNLNFDVTMVPQIRDAAKRTVFAHMYAFSLVKQSKQLSGGFTAISALTQDAPIQSLEAVTNLPPVLRSLVGTKPADPFRTVFYSSALLSHSWIDPDPTASAKTFRDMIESITSGRSRPLDALSTADEQLRAELK